jgi:hypothetical protein
MTTTPVNVMERETFLSHEIRVGAFGPVRTEPNELQTHYTAQISIWAEGVEIREAKQAPAIRFLSEEDAIQFGFEIGRMVVTQRRKSKASNLMVCVREFFKLPRLLFRN